MMDDSRNSQELVEMVMELAARLVPRRVYDFRLCIVLIVPVVIILKPSSLASSIGMMKREREKKASY